jgi:hypothetical protein
MALVPVMTRGESLHVAAGLANQPLPLATDSGDEVSQRRRGSAQDRSGYAWPEAEQFGAVDGT